jgi:hypothetical protein
MSCSEREILPRLLKVIILQFRNKVTAAFFSIAPRAVATATYVKFLNPLLKKTTKLRGL